MSREERFISFSLGVESTTMCVLYGKGAKAIWCDTGAEHKEVYERMDYCEKKLMEIHKGDFEIIKIKASVMAKGNIVDSLIDYIEAYRYMPSMSARFCTKEFKIIPIDNFLSEQGECELMIGFNADEEPGEDRTGNFMKCPNVKYTYPLYEAGLSREDCEEILISNDLHPSYPFYMQRGGCFICFYKKLADVKALYFFDKGSFKKIRELEERVQDKRKSKFPLMVGIGRTMEQIQNECDTELFTWGESEIEKMYKKNVQHNKPCGAFCHR